MQLTNVSEGSAKAGAAQTETFQGYTVVDGKVQGGYFTRASTLESLQKEYEAANAKKGSEDVPMWKRPFVFISNAMSNLLGLFNSAFKAVFFCFFTAEKAEGEGTKADSKTKKADNK